ncbi:uncharacterized protein CFAP92 [Indicator indicator]|uniref:uncharacterized protein CFAP92 n=1 Tax=Indicator indicator TaxID=1002788 RepID=UPI0023DEA204|nr:uncharacterized protein CFAP92 [Indicator indicator]
MPELTPTAVRRGPPPPRAFLLQVKMAEQKQNNLSAVSEEEVEEQDENEMTGLNTIPSKSALETEKLVALGESGHLISEAKSVKFLLSEKHSMEQDGFHLVTCTFTVSLAVLAKPAGERQETSNHPDMPGKRTQASNLGTRPKTQRCYHMEYFLLPDDPLPRKLDLVLVGLVAKLRTHSNSKTIRPWFENEKMWLSWKHSIDIRVTNEYLIKLRDHKIILRIWATEGKASLKSRQSKTNIISSLEGDAEAVGRNRSDLKRNSMAKSSVTASLQLDVMPLLAGERAVVTRLAEDSPEILDAYMTFTVEAPLMSERQRHDLNPLVIRIKSATHLPNTPVPIEVLQRVCAPIYCKYKFHHFPPHQTQGQAHGTHVYFNDVNVLLTGTMQPGELQRYLVGPPLEIEVHDRDRKMDQSRKKPSLLEESEADGNVGEGSSLVCKPTVSSSCRKKEVWHPHGVANVSLTDLLEGQKYLNIRAPILNCSPPDTAAFSKDRSHKRGGSVSGSPSLLMAHYLESGSLLKVRVEIAVPLRMSAEMADAPYGYIIYIFDYNKSSLSHDLVEDISATNAEALQPHCSLPHSITLDCAALRLQSTPEKVSEMDIVTGFHLLDGETHLFVLEGLKDKAIKRIWDRHFERAHRHQDGQLEVLYNSGLSFPQRLYVDLEAIFYHFLLCQPLSDLAKQPQPYVTYIRGRIPPESFQALSRLSSLCQSKSLRGVIRGDLLPSAKMITAFSHQYGVPLTCDNVSEVCMQEEKGTRDKRASGRNYIPERQENAVRANKEAMLPRERWGWDQRHIDFDLYKKPPEFFGATAPRTGNGPAKIN